MAPGLTNGAEKAIETKSTWPLVLRAPFLGSLSGVLCVVALALEAGYYVVDQRYGGIGPVNPNTWIHFSWTLTPVIIAQMISGIIASVAFNTQRIQPWLALLEGNAPASKSLLLDYPGLSMLRIPLAAFKNRHWLVLMSSGMTLLTIVTSTVASGLFSLQFAPRLYEAPIQPFQDLRLQYWYQSLVGFFNAAATTSAVFNLDGMNGSFTPQKYTSDDGWTTGQYFMVDPLQFATASGSSTSGQSPSNITFTTTVIKSFSGCETTSLDISSIGNANGTYKWSIGARGDVSHCAYTMEVDIGDNCCDQWDVASVNCTVPGTTTSPPPPSLQSVAFWIVMPQEDLTRTPNASMVICTPSAQTGQATVTYDLTSKAIVNVASSSNSAGNDEVSGLQRLGSLVDSANSSNVVDFNGRLFNGYFLSDFWEGDDSYKDARLTAVQYIIKSTIYYLAHNSGPGGTMANIYTPGQEESFFNLTNTVYSRYLSLAAQQVYFDPPQPPTVIDRDPILATVREPELRLFMSAVAAHVLSSALLMLVVLAMASLLLRCSRVRSAVKEVPSTEELAPMGPWHWNQDRPTMSRAHLPHSSSRPAAQRATDLMPIPPMNIGSIAAGAAATYGVRDLAEFFADREAIESSLGKVDQKPEALESWRGFSFGFDQRTGKVLCEKPDDDA